jgi:hypothetical protein
MAKSVDGDRKERARPHDRERVSPVGSRVFAGRVFASLRAFEAETAVDCRRRTSQKRGYANRFRVESFLGVEGKSMTQTIFEVAGGRQAFLDLAHA